MGTTASGFIYPDTGYTAGVRQAIEDLADSAEDVIREAGIPRFADAGARDAAITAPVLGMKAALTSDEITYRYNGSAWKAWESDWIDYAATLGAASGTFSVGTGGSAENTTEYKWVDGRVLIRYKFVLGSSGQSMGTAPTFTAPFNLKQNVAKYQWLVSRGSMYDTSAGSAPTEATNRLNDTDANKIVISTYTGTVANVTSTAPFTWAAGDIIAGECWAEPA